MANSNSNVNAVSIPAALISQGDSEGTMISVSCNTIMALTLLEGYMNSTYSLQAADTQLEATISNEEATLVQQFQTDMSSSSAPSNASDTYSNWLYQLSQTSDSGQMGKLAQLYAACNAENQAETKVMDGDNSTAQNTMNQNAQGQQGVIQTMQSVNGISGNLTRLIQG